MAVWDNVTDGGLITLLNGATRTELQNVASQLTGARAEARLASRQLEGLLDRQWRDVTSSRREDQCYGNDTDYPIEIAVSSTGASTTTERRNYNFCQLEILIEQEALLLGVNNNDDGGSKYCAATATVPPGQRYEVNADGFRQGGILMWWELRDPIDSAPPAEC